MCFTVKKLNLLALIVSKFLEILHWLAAALMLCLLALCLAAPNWLSGLLAQGAQRFGRELTTYGFTLTVAGADGSVNLAAVALFTVGAISILSLMAMVFRNVYLIFRTAKGKTWFAKGDTPFQKDIVRMVREIGIFYLAVQMCIRDRINDLLHECGGYIVGRMGLPYRERGVSVICVIIDAPGDVISALSGKLGMLPGVTAKTMTSKAPLRPDAP